MNRKKAAVAAGIMAAVVGGGASAAFAANGAPGTAGNGRMSLAGGFHACIETGNHIKHTAIYPNDRYHPLTCKRPHDVLYVWPSQKAMEAAVAKLNARIDAIPAGKDGKDGAPGAPGKDGADGVSGYEIVGRTADSSTETGEQTLTTACPAGKTAIGGGIKGDTNVTVHATYPSGISEVPGSEVPGNEAGTWYAMSWTVSYANAGTGKVQPYVTCMTAPAAPAPAQ